jgi:hypothetical protein
MNISITISGSSLSEVLAGMTSTIEAIGGAKQTNGKASTIVSEKGRSCGQAAIKARCDKCNGDAKGKLFCYGFQKCPKILAHPAQSCAYCGQQLNQQSLVKSELGLFCSCYCLCRYEDSKGPRINDHSRHAIVPDTGQYWATEAHRKLLYYIRECLRHEMDFADILFSLKQLKGISMSPAELGSIIGEMTE